METITLENETLASSPSEALATTRGCGDAARPLHGQRCQLVAHRFISLRCGIWSLPGHSGLCQADRPADLWVHGLWFALALNDGRPLFVFAGIWTTFTGDRGTKSKPITGPHNVYGFLTTAPNAVVEPIHPKAMPVILTTDEERDVWGADKEDRAAALS
jgi:hypothetical protein